MIVVSTAFMTTLTQEEITQVRSALTDNPNVLAALNEIEFPSGNPISAVQGSGTCDSVQLLFGIALNNRSNCPDYKGQ